MTTNRNIVELEELEGGIENVPDLINALNDKIVELNFILSQLTFGNLDGQLLTIVIPATGSTITPHRLSRVPVHRTILRQSGGGVIRDGTFTKDNIELINDGASIATLTVLISKG